MAIWREKSRGAYNLVLLGDKWTKIFQNEIREFFLKEIVNTLNYKYILHLNMLMTTIKSVTINNNCQFVHLQITKLA